MHHLGRYFHTVRYKYTKCLFKIPSTSQDTSKVTISWDSLYTLYDAACIELPANTLVCSHEVFFHVESNFNNGR